MNLPCQRCLTHRGRPARDVSTTGLSEAAEEAVTFWPVRNPDGGLIGVFSGYPP